MENPKPSDQISDLSLVGFEKVFVRGEQSSCSEQSAEKANIHESVQTIEADSFELVTMAEASRRMQIPYPTLRRQVLAGKIPNVAGPDGKVMVKVMATENSLNSSEQKTARHEQTAFPSEYSLTIQRLLDQLESERDHAHLMSEKLESATYRNGYLEAQLASRDEQIKLLIDGQHKENWWRRFCAWALGRPGV